MYCSKCGYDAGTSLYCPACGAPVNVKSAPPIRSSERESDLLTFSIIAAVLADIIGLPGLIMGLISLRRVKEYLELGFPYVAKVRVSKYLSVFSVIAGAVVTALWVLVIFYVIFVIILLNSIS